MKVELKMVNGALHRIVDTRTKLLGRGRAGVGRWLPFSS
jgi:hypothetical protein